MADDEKAKIPDRLGPAIEGLFIAVAAIVLLWAALDGLFSRPDPASAAAFILLPTAAIVFAILFAVGIALLFFNWMRAVGYAFGVVVSILGVFAYLVSAPETLKKQAIERRLAVDSAVRSAASKTVPKFVGEPPVLEITRGRASENAAIHVALQSAWASAFKQTDGKTRILVRGRGDECWNANNIVLTLKLIADGLVTGASDTDCVITKFTPDAPDAIVIIEGSTSIADLNEFGVDRPYFHGLGHDVGDFVRRIDKRYSHIARIVRQDQGEATRHLPHSEFCDGVHLFEVMICMATGVRPDARPSHAVARDAHSDFRIGMKWIGHVGEAQNWAEIILRRSIKNEHELSGGNQSPEGELLKIAIELIEKRTHSAHRLALALANGDVVGKQFGYGDQITFATRFVHHYCANADKINTSSIPANLDGVERTIRTIHPGFDSTIGDCAFRLKVAHHLPDRFRTLMKAVKGKAR